MTISDVAGPAWFWLIPLICVALMLVFCLGLGRRRCCGRMKSCGRHSSSTTPSQDEN